MTLTAIVAMTPERVIGRDNALPWHFPEDLRFFKRTTSGHPVVVGRKTYDSIGRALPGRQNIVLTRERSWSAEGVTVIHSPEELSSLELQDPDVFVMGGAEIYALFLPLLDELLISKLLYTILVQDGHGSLPVPQERRNGPQELLQVLQVSKHCLAL